MYTNKLKDAADYNREGYKYFLRVAIDEGFQFRDYYSINLKENQKQIILRHDIDFSPFMAAEMAMIEHELGINSIYAILMDSMSYNVFSDDVMTAIKKIKRLGHSIALHYRVPGNLGIDNDGITKDVLKQHRVLTEFYPYLSKVFVWHNFIDTIGFDEYMNFQVKGFVNAYHENYVKDMKYVSDSNMRYNYNELLLFLRRDSRYLHILLHPVNWIPEKGTVVGCLKVSFEEFVISRFKHLSINKTWQSEFGQGGEVSIEGILRLIKDG